MIRELIEEIELEKMAEEALQADEIELLAREYLEKEGMSFLKMRKAVSLASKDAPKAVSGTPNPRLFGKARVGGRGAGRAKGEEARTAYRAAQRSARMR